MTFEFGKIYEVNSEWKQYFDGFGKDCLGYYYVTPEEPISYEIQKCLVINKDKKGHPYFVLAIPFKFADCKLCSLSSTAELKLFKLTRLDAYDPRYDIVEIILVAKNEEEAKLLRVKDYWVSDSSKVITEYLGDYFGELPTGSIIMTKKDD